MKSKVSSGVWLIFLGIIALLHNFNIIDFNFWAIIKYWPLLIISIGINLIFQNRPHGASILLMANVALCLFLTYQGLTSQDQIFSWNTSIKNNANKIENFENAETEVKVDYQPVEHASLEFNLGAASVKLNHQTDQEHLLYANSSKGQAGLKLESSIHNNKAELELNSIGKDTVTKKNEHIFITLHEQPIWDFSFNTGASAFDADLSTFKIEKMEVNAGAADVKLKLGMPYSDITKIEINAAASSTKIDIPKEAACRVETTTIFSANKLKGFIKKDNAYVTENYEQAEKKYNIEVSGAANSLKINRY